jgi:hypothetical protein
MGGGERRPSGLPHGHMACMPPSTKEEQRGDVIILFESYHLIFLEKRADNI